MPKHMHKNELDDEGFQSKGFNDEESREIAKAFGEFFWVSGKFSGKKFVFNFWFIGRNTFIETFLI